MLTIAQEEGQRFAEFLKKIETKPINMAAILEVQRGTISKYISGEIRIPSDTVVFLHKEYKLSFDFHFCGIRPILVKDQKEKNLVTSTEELKMQVNLISKKLDGYVSKTDKLITDFYAFKNNS